MSKILLSIFMTLTAITIGSGCNSGVSAPHARKESIYLPHETPFRPHTSPLDESGAKKWEKTLRAIDPTLPNPLQYSAKPGR